MPVACLVAWSVAFLAGLLILSAAESLCPADQMDSGMCMAPWWPPIEKTIFCFSTGLSAVLVVAAGVFVASAARASVAWLVFGIGSIFALWGTVECEAWAEGTSAIAAGFLTAWLLSRSRYARKASRVPQVTEIDRSP